MYEHKLPNQEHVLYGILTESPVLDAIIQKADVESLIILMSLKNQSLTQKIAEHFVSNAQVRRTICCDFAILRGHFADLLNETANISGVLFATMVLLSNDAIDCLLDPKGEDLAREFINAASNDQIIDLMLSEKIRELLFKPDDKLNPAPPFIVLLRAELANLNKYLKGNTSKSRVRKLLPYLIQHCYLPRGSLDPLPSEGQVHKELKAFIFTKTDGFFAHFAFSPEFMALLHSATGEDLYNILTACRVPEKAIHKHLDEFARNFLRLMYEAGAGTDSQRYPELVDEMLMNCTADQLLDLMSHERLNHEFICDRIIKLCLDTPKKDSAYQNNTLVAHLVEMLGSDEISVAQMITFLKNIQQYKSSRIAMLFNQEIYDVALDKLDRENVDVGNPVPWNFAHLLGTILNDHEKIYLHQLISDPEALETVYNILTEMCITPGNNIRFKTSSRELSSNSIYNHLLTFLKELNKYFLVKDEKDEYRYFREYMSRFEVHLDNEEEGGTKFFSGIKICYSTSPTTELSKYDQEILGHVIQKKGEYQFWEQFLSECDIRLLCVELIEPHMVTTRLIRSFLEILCVNDDEFCKNYLRKRYKVVQTSKDDNQLRTIEDNRVPTREQKELFDRVIKIRAQKRLTPFGKLCEELLVGVVTGSEVRGESTDSLDDSEGSENEGFEIRGRRDGVDDELRRGAEPPVTPVSGLRSSVMVRGGFPN